MTSIHLAPELRLTSPSTLLIMVTRKRRTQIAARNAKGNAGEAGLGESASMRKSNATAAMRVQYAALPYRRRGLNRTEVLLVTSRESGRWIIPKGWPIKHAAPRATAKREAREEAGVIGTISRQPIGSYSYEKHLKRGRIAVCNVQVFALKVRRQQESWPEKGQRRMQWLSWSKAAKTVGDPVLGQIIRMLAKR
jgi:8-oxo-dGTP pyrophosphatase MutT (NUDIX family)